ncbi:MAG: twin-arginine translocase TatA/TatE family subunit [Bacteroidales bacterium]|nr:twin-arginine translocase TatA/TatE family subunit [Bacteroidales bacterium]MCF8338663.1 twin-arginine translocase TatA/TatE family subunit [Bacteroidales bacterium]
MVAQILLFFDISTGEIFIILLVLFLVFGPQKMPEMARKIGKVINRMKQATSDLTREFNEGATEVTDTLDKEAKEIRDEVYETKKEFDKENKKFENELSIKTDINNRGAKKRASTNEERENTEVRDKEKFQDNDSSTNQ